MSKSSDDSRDPLGDWGAWDDYEQMMQEQGEFEPPSFEPDHAAFDKLAAALTPQQITAATHVGPIQVLAGAGTGKTSTLTAAAVHKIAVQGIAPSRILAATFTNKAASEMTKRIQDAISGQQAPGWLGTYHGLAARQLRASPEVAGLRANFDILDADDSRRIVKRVMKAFNLSGADDEPSVSRDPIKTICNQISRWKDNLLTPHGAAQAVDQTIAKAHGRGERIDVGALKSAFRVYTAYQSALREANAADFGDLLLWTTLAMLRDPAYCERWQSKFDAILADEYQDVNFAQYSWLKALAKEHRNIFVVGDDDQSI